jgi:hypothetical protein
VQSYIQKNELFNSVSNIFEISLTPIAVRKGRKEIKIYGPGHGMVVHICDSSYAEGKDRQIMVSGLL